MNLDELTTLLVSLSPRDFRQVVNNAHRARAINRRNSRQPRTQEQKVQFRKQFDKQVSGR